MDVVCRAGQLGPAHSFTLEEELSELTTSVRPFVVVDLSETTWIHPAVLSVVIRHRRQARRQGGDVVIAAPEDPSARRVLDHVGLLSPAAAA